MDGQKIERAKCKKDWKRQLEAMCATLQYITFSRCTTFVRQSAGRRRRAVQVTNNTQSLRMFPDPILPYMFIYLITEPSRAIRSDQAQVHETVMESVYMSPELCILKVVPARLQSQFLARQACLFPALRYITLPSRAVRKQDGCPTGPIHRC